MQQRKTHVSERLSVLQPTESHGNVGDVCHRHGMARIMFDEYEKCLHVLGLEGLKGLPARA